MNVYLKLSEIPKGWYSHIKGKSVEENSKPISVELLEDGKLVLRDGSRRIKAAIDSGKTFIAVRITWSVFFEKVISLPK